MLKKIGNDESNLVTEVHRLLVADECEAEPVWQTTHHLFFCFVSGTHQNIKHVK